MIYLDVNQPICTVIESRKMCMLAVSGRTDIIYLSIQETSKHLK